MDSNIDDSDATSYHITEDPTDLYEEEIISSLDTSLDTDSSDNQSVQISTLNEQINDDKDSDYKIDDNNDNDDDVTTNVKPITDHQYIRHPASKSRHRKRRQLQTEINDENRIDVDVFYGFVNINGNDYVKKLRLINNYLKSKEKLDAFKSLNISNDFSENNESSSLLINENIIENVAGEYAMTIADVAKFGRRSLTKQSSSTSFTSSTSTATTAQTPTRTPRKSKIETTPTKSDTPKTYAGRRLKYLTSENLINTSAAATISPSISAVTPETGQEEKVEPLPASESSVQDIRHDNNLLINEILEKLKLGENFAKQMVDICFQELKTIEEYSTIFVQSNNKPSPSSDNTTLIITHEIIKNKVTTGSYESIESYHSDIKTMIDYYILTTPECTNRIKKDLKHILNQCKQDEYDLNACTECFLNSKRQKTTLTTENFFINVCRRPHLLVWAKLKGYPYWPAKVISINKANSIDIRFFGGHQRASISPKDCYLFTENDPKLIVSTTKTLNSNPTTTTSNDTKDKSLAEINEHIKVIKNVMGKFVYAKEITKLSPKRLNHYISMMFPTYNFDENNGINKTFAELPLTSFENELKLTIIKTPDNNLTVKNYRPNVIVQQQPKLIDSDNDMYEVVTQSKLNDNEKCVESLIIKRKLTPTSSKTPLSSVISKTSTTSSKDDKIIEKQQHDKEIFENAVKSLPSSIVITPVSVSSTTTVPSPTLPSPPTTPIDGECTITLTRLTSRQQPVQPTTNEGEQEKHTEKQYKDNEYEKNQQQCENQLKQQLVQPTTTQSNEGEQENHQEKQCKDNEQEKNQGDNLQQNLIQSEQQEKLDQEKPQHGKQNTEPFEENQEELQQHKRSKVKEQEKLHHEQQQEKQEEKLYEEMVHQEKLLKQVLDTQNQEKQEQNIEEQQQKKQNKEEQQEKLHQDKQFQENQNKAKQLQEKQNLENELEKQNIKSQQEKVHQEKQQHEKQKQGKPQQILVKQKPEKHIPENPDKQNKDILQQENLHQDKQIQAIQNETKQHQEKQNLENELEQQNIESQQEKVHHEKQQHEKPKPGKPQQKQHILVKQKPEKHIQEHQDKQNKDKLQQENLHKDKQFQEKQNLENELEKQNIGNHQEKVHEEPTTNQQHEKQKPEKQQQKQQIQVKQKSEKHIPENPDKQNKDILQQENLHQDKQIQAIQNETKQHQEKQNLENELEKQNIENQQEKAHHEKQQHEKQNQGKQQQQQRIVIKQKPEKPIQEHHDKLHKEKPLQEKLQQEKLNFEKQEQRLQQENLKEQQQILMDSFQSTEPGPSSASLGSPSASLASSTPTLNSLELVTKSNQINSNNKNRVRVRDIRTLITKPPNLPPPLTYHTRSTSKTSTITSGQYEQSLLDNHGGSIEWPITITTNASMNVPTTKINEPSSLIHIHCIDEIMPLVGPGKQPSVLVSNNNQMNDILQSSLQQKSNPKLNATSSISALSAPRITTTISESPSSLMNDIEKLIPIDCTALSSAAGDQSTGLFSNINQKINDMLISHIQQTLNEKFNTSKALTHRNNDNENSLAEINTKATIQQLTDKIKHIKLANKETLTKFQDDLNNQLIELQRQHEIDMGHLKNMEIQRNNVERQQIINELKLKQWCNNCRKEAFFHCCWNTEYCDVKCQNEHWPKHVQSCTRILVENRSAINYVRIVDTFDSITTTGTDTTSNDIKLTPVIGSMVIPPPQLRKHNLPRRQLQQFKTSSPYNLHKQPNFLPEYNIHQQPRQQHQQICLQRPNAYTEYNDQLQHVLPTQSAYQWHHRQQRQKQQSVRKRQQNKTDK